MRVFFLYTAFLFITGSTCMFIPKRKILMDEIKVPRKSKYKKYEFDSADSKERFYLSYKMDRSSDKNWKGQSNLDLTEEKVQNTNEVQENKKRNNLFSRNMIPKFGTRRKRSTFDSISQSAGFEGFNSNDRIQRNIRRLRRLQRLQRQQRQRSNRAPYAIEIVMPILHRRVNEPAIEDIIIEV